MTFLALVNMERLNLDLNFHFCAKSYFILASVQNFNHFDSQLWKYCMKIVSKDFCLLTGVCIAIYMWPCRRSYIPPVQKFRTSKMLNNWSPIFKLSDIKLSQIPDGRYENAPVRYTY